MKEQKEKIKVRADPDRINPTDEKEPSAAEFLLFRSEATDFSDSDRGEAT